MRRALLLCLGVLGVVSGCGATASMRPPTAAERPAIVHALVRFAGPRAHSLLHIDVRSIRVLRSDPQFASAAVQEVTAQGQPASVGGETEVVVLMQAAGSWQLVGSGTAFFDYCSRPSSKPLKALLCPNAYANLGIK